MRICPQLSPNLIYFSRDRRLRSRIGQIRLDLPASNLRVGPSLEPLLLTVPAEPNRLRANLLRTRRPGLPRGGAEGELGNPRTIPSVIDSRRQALLFHV